MFTGLIEEIGTIISVNPAGSGLRLKIQCTKILSDLAVDHSVSVNGTCLTAVRVGNGFFEADAVAETVAVTTLRQLKHGDAVNLERAMRLSDRLGGHLVTGHVDAMVPLSLLKKSPHDIRITVQITKEWMPFVISKGSITLDGISLTVASVAGTAITAAIIPHTFEATTLKNRRAGDFLNMEVDLIGKYISKMMADSTLSAGISEKWLNDIGF